MTTIKSGYFQTPTNTPTGQRKKIAVDNPYISKDEYIQTLGAEALGIDQNSRIYTNGQLERIILRASAWVNRYCERWFDTQTIDETKSGILVRPMNPQLVTVVLQNAPYQHIDNIYIQVLKWFIQIDTSESSGYLQDFPDYGYYKIVPLLSNAGTGTGSPLPAEIVDRTPLGILWTRYTSGYGTPLTGQSMIGDIGTNKVFQSPLGNRLWAPDQPTTIYNNGVEVASSDYSVDYPNGIVTFTTAPAVGPITADFTSNESIPEDVRQAVIMLINNMIFKESQNPGGLDSMNITSYSVSYGESVIESVKEILNHFRRNRIKVI